MKYFFLPSIIAMLWAHSATAQVDTSKTQNPPGPLLSKEIIVVTGATPTVTKESGNVTNGKIKSTAKGESSQTQPMSSQMQSMMVAPASSAGTTNGTLDVSSTGGSTYVVPFTLPPGLGDYIPQVGFSYNSQNGNGLLGLGWGISGLSSISRIGSTTFHDGMIRPVEFSANDHFALDGQRLLLKSGVYGSDGAQYETESFSNLKIVSRGVSPFGASFGPAYFEVFYPDGSKAVYGESTNSRTKNSFGITYSQNALGARINYSYAISENTMRITEISYGSLGPSQALNKILFNYSETNSGETSYIAGTRHYTRSLLNKVSITANGSAFRHYVLTYAGVTRLYYKRISQITEYDGNEANSKGPIYFTYGSTGDLTTVNHLNSLSVTGIASNNSTVVPADYTGNGTMDFLLVPNSKDKFWAFYDMEPNSPYMQLGYQLNTGPFREVFSGTLLSWNGKVLPGQGIFMVKENGSDAFKFETYAATSYMPALFQYDKFWDNIPRVGGYYSECDNQFHDGPPVKQEFFSGDFNGDGLADVIAIGRPEYNVIYYERRQETNPWDPGYNHENPVQVIDPIGLGDCVREYTDMNYSQVHYVNMDRRITTNYVAGAGVLMRPYIYGDKILTGDFNGDGKTDLLHVYPGGMYVYSLNTSNSYLDMLWHVTDSRISTTEQLLLGDYNGDGKVDVMFSTLSRQSGPRPTRDDQSFVFAMFMSSGKTFEKHEVRHPFNSETDSWDGTYLKQNWLIASDVNGDGKTDIVATSVVTQNSIGGSAGIGVYHNMGASTDMKVDFNYVGLNSGVPIGAHYPIPLFLNVEKGNPNLEYGLLSKDAGRLFRFHKNVKSETQITSVVKDAVTYDISYRNLDATTGYVQFPYESGYEQTYPYVDHHNMPGFPVVDKITRTYGSNQIEQVFGYANAVSNIEGLGFLGFGKVFRSNFHTGNGDPNRMFEMTISDPLLRGAAVKNFRLKYPYVNSAMLAVSAANDGATINDYIKRSDISYQTTLTPNKVFKLLPVATVSKDLLEGTTLNSTLEYDTYSNATKVSTITNGQFTETVDNTYDNDQSGYYIGRLLTSKKTISVPGDTYSSEREMVYNGSFALPITIKNKGNGTPWITENLTYDGFGNVIHKSTTTNTGVRTTSTVYDATGRFAISQTDVEGLTSTANYDPSTGNVISRTGVYGQSTVNSYDSWDRIIETTDYLGKKKYYGYATNSNGYILTQTDDEGNETATYINHLGQTTQTTEKTVTGSLVGTATEYDVYGQAYRQSEPSIPGSYSQWNETEFNQYGQVERVTKYTGQSSQYTYNGLVRTVNDGSRSIVTTKNALGQIISIQDPGGTINYDYYAHGGLKSANYGGAIQSLEYDGWGRKTKLVDPSAGTYNYVYNGFGEVLQEVTPKGTTDYTYDASTGRLNSKSVNGDATNLAFSYNYNNTTKLLESLTFTNGDGNNATYTYAYDQFNRIIESVEDNLHARFTKGYTYDSFGRVDTELYTAKDKASNVTAARTVGYTYQNGKLLQATDLTTGKVLSKINTLKANGQLGTVIQGTSLKTTYNYDNYNQSQSTVTERTGTSPGILIDLGYNFDPLRGNLNSRSNSVFGWAESFTYDNLDRLTDFNDNNGNNSQSYDGRGRITSNSQLGSYGYNGHSYQQMELTSLTAGADNWYQTRANQQISFNTFKKPVNINEQGAEQLDFQYNALLQRAHMYYGSADADKLLRPMRRHYSEDGGMEITRNLNTGETSFVFYLSGDAYDAPAIYKELHNSAGNTQSLYYLHRDHLGSIVLITDVDGNAIEKRQFDAWGNVVALADGNGNTLTAFVISDRGYTGHEHLLNVGLINMNGRLYDPKLHRFLSPDNFVQDYTNTQNFNRYGYAMNNPFMYTDASGEFLHIIVGAVVGGVINLTVKAVQGKIKNFGDGFAAFGIGAVAGGLGAATGGASLAATGLTGASVVGGALAGTAGSIVASPIQGIGNAIYFGDKYTLKSFGRDVLVGAVGGAVVGGTIAFIKGKNIWFGTDVAAGRTKFSFNNTDQVTHKSTSIGYSRKELAEMGYSTDDLADGGVGIGKIKRNLNTDDVVEFLKNNDILARKGNQISKEIVDEYLQQMKNNTFDLRHGAGGYRQGATYLIDDGHHRIVAGAIRGMQTGDFSYLQQMLRNGNFRPWTSGNLKFGSFPSRWKP